MSLQWKYAGCLEEVESQDSVLEKSRNSWSGRLESGWRSVMVNLKSLVVRSQRRLLTKRAMQ